MKYVHWISLEFHAGESFIHFSLTVELGSQSRKEHMELFSTTIL
jgi:hypothetical protein